MENTGLSHAIDRLLLWLRDSVTVKLFIIGLLVLILLIPTVWILALMEERQQRANEVFWEVSAKWSGSQTLAGPVMVIPFMESETFFNGQGKSETRLVRHEAFFLPDSLVFTANIQPQLLHRGIFDVAVYQSNISVQAVFGNTQFEAAKVNPAKALWHEAYLVLGISDLRGISHEEPRIQSGQVTLTSEPAQQLPFVFCPQGTTGIRIPLHTASGSSNLSTDITIDFKLKGSEHLYVIPAAKTTFVRMEGKWAHPGFDGAFLPDYRTLSDSAFAADWKILHFNRAIPQHWVDERPDLSATAFGVKLIVPADQYQKSMRTAKYGSLLILFTFIALFIMEVISGIRIHPFQYILIGAGLVIYYTLLLSFSEHIGFNLSYWVSATATIALITAYASGFLKMKKQILTLALLLVVLYLFIFVMTLQQDYALLTGSIGLFVVLGVLMYVTRRINWYRQ